MSNKFTRKRIILKKKKEENIDNFFKERPGINKNILEFVSNTHVIIYTNKLIQGVKEPKQITDIKKKIGMKLINKEKIMKIINKEQINTLGFKDSEFVLFYF